MKNWHRFCIDLSLLIPLVFCSCSAGSEVEMNEAQQMMDQAKSLHAEELAPSDWKQAMQAWNQAHAAVKSGKPAKNSFLNAKSRFKKAGAIAKANGETMAKDIAEMQLSIDSRLSKVKSDLVKRNAAGKTRDRINSITSEVESGSDSVNTLVAQRDYLKAKNIATDIQKKIFNAELILDGKKPTF
jgi:hypothetical protein